MSEYPQGVKEFPGRRGLFPHVSNSNDCIDYAGRPGIPINADMTSFNSQIDLLSRLVEAGDLRQQVIGQNIANVNTPNYKRLQVDFEQLLTEELKRNPAQQTSTAPAVTKTTGLEARADGNNVDVDMEIGHMNKNALMQQVYLQLIASEMSMMRNAIRGN